MRISFITAIVALLLVPQAMAQEDAGIGVDEIVFCTAVEDRQPVGANSQFFETLDRIYCYTRITGCRAETAVFHVWYFGDEEKARVELPVRSAYWRTWSSKQILDSWSGAWRVDVVTAEGDVIATGEFIYKPVSE